MISKNKNKWLLGWVLGLLLSLATSALYARSVLDLDTQAQPVALKDWGDYWVDPTGQASAQQVGNSENLNWQPTRTQGVYPLTTGQVLWIRFTVPPAPDTERWYLSVPYPALNQAWLYTRDAIGQWQEQRAGDSVAVNQWPVPHRHPLLPIALSAESPTHYLLRIEHNVAFGAPLQFLSTAYLNRSEQRTSLLLGIFFGLAGLAVLVSVINAVSLRDPAHGLYALCVTLMALTQACVTGIAGLHLWPDHPWWNDVATSVAATLELAAILLFIAAMVSLSKRSARLHRMLLMVVLGGVGISVALAFISSAQRAALFTPWVLFVQLLGIYVLVWTWYRGDRFAGWVLVSFAPAVAAGVYLLLASSGLVPASLLTEHGMQIALSLELPAILVILMLRSQQRRENSQRIHGLSRIDPSTGLLNEHTFIERMNHMIARSHRFKHLSAVILVDLVNSEQIQRDFGRKAANELPLHVAERLLSTAREIDSAARLSEFRFGMLVEGPFSAEEAATLGPRIVARCLMPYKGLPIACVAQVRVAYALVPRQGPSVGIVMARLEERLQSTQDDDKRAVFMVSDYHVPA